MARPSITLNKKIPTQSQNFYCCVWRIFFSPSHIFHSTIIFFCILSFIICIFCAAYHRSSYKLHLRCKKKEKKIAKIPNSQVVERRSRLLFLSHMQAHMHLLMCCQKHTSYLELYICIYILIQFDVVKKNMFF